MKKKLNSKPLAVGLVFGVGLVLATRNYVWNNFLCCT